MKKIINNWEKDSIEDLYIMKMWNKRTHINNNYGLILLYNRILLYIYNFIIYIIELYDFNIKLSDSYK